MMTSEAKCAKPGQGAETPFHCGSCNYPIGVTTGRTLTIGAAKFQKPVILQCAVCGHRRRWAPMDTDG